MRYHISTTDYDGTLASDDQVAPASVQALARLKATGRKLVLVTGRQLEELKTVFPEYSVFDRIVAENGALICRPTTLELRMLAERPHQHFLDCLSQKNIPFSVGHVIVAIWEPHHISMLEAIKETGSEYQVIFNKGAVMVLPPGVNKATGCPARRASGFFSEIAGLNTEADVLNTRSLLAKSEADLLAAQLN